MSSHESHQIVEGPFLEHSAFIRWIDPHFVEKTLGCLPRNLSRPGAGEDGRLKTQTEYLKDG
jgi:hypothetical protein